MSSCEKTGMKLFCHILIYGISIIIHLVTFALRVKLELKTFCDTILQLFFDEGKIVI